MFMSIQETSKCKTLSGAPHISVMLTQLMDFAALW
jgi:hypothetical protein